MSGVRGFVGVTDDSWYQLLADRPDLLGEVNFWRPGGGGFRALRPGEPFFFKTHAPHNRVVGGGFFGGAARLPASEAWDLLGPANGAVSLRQMLDRIAYYRREPRAFGEDPVIGCVFIRDVMFFPDDLTFDPPPDFSSNVVQGKGYDMGDERYSRYFGDLMQMVLGVAVELDLSQPWHSSGPVFGDPRLAPNRLGQQAFKAVVGDTYHWRCAITGAKIRPVLEAAHIRPVSPLRGGENRLDNGLLLRSDVHRMFDLGYLSVDTRYRLRVSSQLRTEFGNGEAFYAKQGTVITLPNRRADQPNVSKRRRRLVSLNSRDKPFVYPANSAHLAARLPVVIDFPGYTAGQLAAIFATLAGEAGFTLTPDAARKAATVLAQAEAGHGSGNARLARRT